MARYFRTFSLMLAFEGGCWRKKLSGSGLSAMSNIYIFGRKYLIAYTELEQENWSRDFIFEFC